MKLFGIVLALAAMAAAVPAQAEDAPRPIEVLVLGTWHFANPGQDLNNVRSDDVRTERRQSEIAALTAALEAFRPTKVMVERVAPAPDLIDPVYAAFTPARLREDRDERVQIAYRLAHRLGHQRVYAIDEQPGPGEPDYFPFGPVAAFAQANGMGEQLQRIMALAASETAAFEERQQRMTIADLLIGYNDPEQFHSSIGGYYRTLAFGNTEEQPGAYLNAMWYLRNAKIFAKLMTVAEPGDRILVVYGAGHNYWLRHFVAETPGYVGIDPRPFLERAARP